MFDSFAIFHQFSDFKIQDKVSISTQSNYELHLSHLPQVGYRHAYLNRGVAQNNTLRYIKVSSEVYWKEKKPTRSFLYVYMFNDSLQRLKW
jgi:hypothetical protein